ncbi:VOC family protein [Saccharothrix mutabilis subsp. mutabilis]|uniref:VOC family protein n=1 Tax=Saccharothrix mutabilis subsp. mutabilis TaxID=66855 RepID=A0ABN0TXA0_9PSEU
MTITGIFPTICSDDIAATRDFYASLFGMSPVFENDWYVQLQAGSTHLQIGVVRRDHGSVPEGHRELPAGTLVAIEVDDVDGVHAKALDAGLTMLLDLRDEPWGQRHFITRDPSGTMVDVIKPIPPDAEHAPSYV